MPATQVPARRATRGKASTSPTTSTPPRIGQIWPGQGGVYVGITPGHAGTQADDHLILGVDPLSIFKRRMLGTYGVHVDGADSTSNGMANTIALGRAGSVLCCEIQMLNIEGHSDYFLMSQKEADLCWANVAEHFEKVWHLTSSQYSSRYAWVQDFGDGRTDDLSKKFEACARVCRRLPVNPSIL